MSPAPIRRSLTLACALATAALLPWSGAAQAADGPSAGSQPSDIGHYYVFRTRDTGQPIPASMERRCESEFGLRSRLTFLKLNARLFSFGSDASTGRIKDATRSPLGPGYLCVVPGTSLSGPMDAYASTSLPGPGTFGATGPCTVAPIIVDNLPLIANCNLNVVPDAAADIEGGLVTSNTLVNVVNRDGTAPTGSVWTAHVIGDPDRKAEDPGPAPTIKPEVAGLDFFVVRTRRSAPATADACRQAGVTGSVIEAETTELDAAQPDSATGRVPDAVGPAVGSITVCYTATKDIGYRASAYAELRAGGTTFAVKASGDCRVGRTPAGRTLRAQACSLVVSSGPAKGGLVTGNALTRAGHPASSANRSLWTFALFGAPAA